MEREKVLIPREFAHIYDDMRDYDEEFLVMLIDKKHQELVDSYLNFSRNREQDEEEFLKFYRVWKAVKLGSAKDPSDKFLISSISLGSLKLFARRKNEELISLSSDSNLTDDLLVKIKLERAKWLQVGSTVAKAIQLTSSNSH